MKAIILSFFFLFMSPVIFGQKSNDVDTNKLILNSKVLLIESLKRYEDLNYYQSYLNFTPQVNFLKSSGFENNFIFYQLHIKDTAIVKTKIDENITMFSPFFQFKDEKVTFAFNTLNNEIYKLDGEKYNDFEIFSKDVISFYKSTYPKLKKRTFHKYFIIEGFSVKR